MYAAFLVAEPSWAAQVVKHQVPFAPPYVLREVREKHPAIIKAEHNRAAIHSRSLSSSSSSIQARNTQNKKVATTCEGSQSQPIINIWAT
jgi:hypothetical protein